MLQPFKLMNPLEYKREDELFVKKQKFMVTRPLPIILLFFIFGLIACFFLYQYIIWIYVGLALLAVAMFLLGAFDKKLLFACIFILVLSLEGLLYLYSFNKNDYLKDGYYSGEAYVESVHSSGKVVLENVVLEGEKLNGKVIANYADVKVGDYIKFAGTLSTFDYHESYGLHRIAGGIYYEMDLSFYRFEYTTSPSFRNRIIFFVKDGLTRAAGETTADYLASILFGESEYLSYEMKSSFTAVGAAHVFAVSGLHIGVLSSVLSFLLKKLKLSNNAIPFVMLPIFGFYAYLCDFSPSVLRASIMFLTASFLTNGRFCSDKPSVLCFSALISLIAKPIWIGDLSFALSYGAILGIYLLYPIMKKPFSELGKLGKIGDVLALNLSVTISLIPLSCLFFSSFSPLAMIASFLIIPITSVLYVLTLICLPLIALSFLIKPVALAAKYLVLLSSFISKTISNVNVPITLRITPYSLLFWYAGLFILSEYNSLSPRKKGLLAIGFIGLTFLI